MVMPRDVGPVHIIGIGGIGMSGIAEILHGLGIAVQGSDRAASANVERIRALGIEVQVGHTAANLGSARVVVPSSAVPADNPEMVAARERSIPIVSRAEMLAELMRFKRGVAIAGTHGKTTTTTLVSTLLDAGGLDPTVINGGVINAYGSNARQGAGDWMVVEADESDGTFVRLPAQVSLVTNIDPEHLDYWKTFEAAQAAFDTFVRRVPFYGFSALCIDHPEVQRLVARVGDRPVVTYGESPQADVRFSNVSTDGSAMTFDVVIRPRGGGERVHLPGLRLPMPGRHNAQNATGAIAIAHGLGVSPEAIREGLAGFEGVRRRFTHVGSWRGVEIFDDYAHHPVELRATLRAAQGASGGKVIAVVQPHRFTRLQELMDDFAACFNDADVLAVAPVYTAGETPIEGVDSAALVQRVRASGHRDARTIRGAAEVAPLVRSLAEPGDFVMLCGAGDISAWAYALPRELGAGTSTGTEASE